MSKEYLFFSILLLLAICSSHMLFAQTSSANYEKSIKFLPQVSPRQLFPISINPDNYTIRLSINGGKWRNRVGIQPGILGFQSGGFSGAIAIEGFVELHDFQEQQLLSWQLWRGNIGLNSFWMWEKLNAAVGGKWRQKWLFELGWDHESQHVTDVDNFFRVFQTEDVNELLNPTLRSFEYIKAKTHLQLFSPDSLWSFYGLVGFRYFFTPVHDDVNRENKVSVETEIGVHRHISPLINLYFHYFYEHISHQQSIISGQLNPFPLRYRIWETGFSLRNRHYRELNIFFSHSNSNGRGIDYFKTYSDFGVGLRLRL